MCRFVPESRRPDIIENYFVAAKALEKQQRHRELNIFTRVIKLIGCKDDDDSIYRFRVSKGA